MYKLGIPTIASIYSKCGTYQWVYRSPTILQRRKLCPDKCLCSLVRRTHQRISDSAPLRCSTPLVYSTLPFRTPNLHPSPPLPVHPPLPPSSYPYALHKG